jgi:hypothetical protein
MRNKRLTAIDRRSFLKGLGLGAAAIPLMRSLPSYAQSEQAPKRMIAFFSPNGTILDNWYPKGSETDFTLSRILAPLAPFKKHLVVLRGMNMNSTKSGPGDGHMKGMGHLLTGTDLERTGPNGEEFKCGGSDPCAGFAGGVSIDQLIANRVVPASVNFKSLTLGVQTGGANVWTRMVYRGPNAPVDPDDNPHSVFGKLFPAGFNQTSVDARRLLAQKKSILDHVTRELTALKGRVDTADAPLFEAHLEGIRSIERRLDGTEVQCATPAEPGALDHRKRDNFPTVGKLQMDMIAAAFACDLARVATLQWSKSVSNVVHKWIGITGDGSSVGHHAMSHESTTYKENLTKINIWYAKQFAYLLGKLAAIPEGDGTLLDNTVVLWGNELSDADRHSRNDMPFVLAGMGKRFSTGSTGRYLTYRGDSHNNLLVSIANAVGVGINSFGNAKYCDGPLKGLI